MTHSTKHFRTMSRWLCGTLLGLAATFAPTPTARGDGEDNPCPCTSYSYFVGCDTRSELVAPDAEDPIPETVKCVGQCASFSVEANVTDAVENWEKVCPGCSGPDPFKVTKSQPDPDVDYLWSPACPDCGATVTCASRAPDQLPAAEPCEQLPNTGSTYNIVSKSPGAILVSCTITGHPPDSPCLKGPWVKTPKWYVVFVAAQIAVETCTDEGIPMEVIATPNPGKTPKGDKTTLGCIEFQRRWKATSAEAWPTEWEDAGYFVRVSDADVYEYVHRPLVGGYYQFRTRNGCCDQWHKSEDQTLILLSDLAEEKPAVCLGDPIKITANWEPEGETAPTCPLEWESAYKSPTAADFSDWGTVSMTAPLPATDDYPHVFTYTPTETGWYKFRARSPDNDDNTDWKYAGEIKAVSISFAETDAVLCWLEGSYNAVPNLRGFDPESVAWSYEAVEGGEGSSLLNGVLTLAASGGLFIVSARSNDNTECTEAVMTVEAVKVVFVEASCPEAANSPHSFEGHVTDLGDACAASDPGHALVVFHRDVRDAAFAVEDFDVTITANVQPPSANAERLSENWAKAAGPISGALNRTDTFVVKYQNPKKGGLYACEFDLGLSGCPKSAAAVLLPLGGPDVTAYYLSEEERYDTWLSAMKARVYATTSDDFVRGNLILAYFTKTVLNMNHKQQTFESGGSPCRAYCPGTVTITDYVFGKDHIGNFLFSYLAARTKFTFGTTRFGANLAAYVTSKVPDAPDDQAAYTAGYAHGENPSTSFRTILESKDIDAMQNESAKRGWPSSDTATGGTYPTWGATRPGLITPD